MFSTNQKPYLPVIGTRLPLGPFSVLETRNSGEYRVVRGQFKRSRKVTAIRGLNKNYNHDLKNIFKGAATRAAFTAGPFQDFHEACVARGLALKRARLSALSGLRRMGLAMRQRHMASEESQRPSPRDKGQRPEDLRRCESNLLSRQYVP